MKKGEIVWDTIAKWALALLFLIAVALVIISNKELMNEIFDKIKNFLRFGT